MLTKFYGGPMDGQLGDSDQPTKRAIVGDMVEGPNGPAFVVYTYLPVHTDGLCQVMYLHDVQVAEFADPHH